MTLLNRTAIALWAIAVIALLLTSISRGTLTGDGREYLLGAHAFASHASPDLRAGDIAFFNTEIAPSRGEAKLDFSTLGEGHAYPGGGAQFDAKGFVRATGGQVYAWHFWLYSLFVAPFLAAVTAIGGKPETAFVLCNGAFVGLALVYLCRFWAGTALQKQLLASLFLLGGTTYYVWWTHPEVFTASLVLLGLMAFDDKRYGLAMGATAAAATQNPPLMFLVLGMGVWSIWQSLPATGNSTRRLRSVIRPIVGTGLALAFAILPVAFYWLTSRVTNPIAAAGWADTSMISLERLISLFLDLNMGMVTALPAVLLASALLLGLWMIGMLTPRSRAVQTQRSWGLPLLLGVGASVVMAIPALGAPNWNHGQTIFARYAYWLAIPITFGLVVTIGRLGRKRALLLTTLLLACQIATVSYYGLWGRRAAFNYVAFKPFVIPVMLHHPELYNPLPEIFAERLQGIDTFHPGNMEGSGVYAFPNPEQPTKILVRSDVIAGEIATRKAHCPDITTHRVEFGWVYINIPRSCYHQEQAGRPATGSATSRP
ncbi:MAG: hypothetical protein JSR83_14380 [Proteobacteria bacterium]|nr:hypothetical protein [Pseudomonadota bacterium]